ncbi:LysR family transcriptional regulator [Pseudoalteromonas sp. SG43-7]|uniref:LysR family transcriptional regulator n=1 Tax=Pseudoalteromonas TaxID=53246 RepID=UPI0015FF1780|nr:MULTISPECIES: LysR family transcriptional regulator [unclassified Pseudoalteromonas]MBB1302921.1 LysR family transcriptional regulator [Pseudoalteromonas sp. SR44-8]MBB1334614.1 LysR family transcriptional regulator [Pseudoalteromonas sp. SR41-6]MBB1344065.1 LysR family transcriptional regulator [Pseudoalteromonas sp. SR45-6]MBB1418410.1 LysR family transcriptional regulator [Pseudoalteromonas sp. SG44-1]MBB1421893.1 LysR family transcriptional regulator [Pseudoalteromonas sp. SG43-7]
MNDFSSINIRALKFFIAVYKCKSFSVVARHENVSPSMVSRVILQLEDALGQQLFYRNTRAIMPTEAGRIFHDYARSMTEQLNEVRNELQDRATQPKGLIRINAPVFFGQKHIAPWLGEFLNRYPKIQVELTQTDDFIDPHIDAADVIFRIGSLADSSLHAKTLGLQTYHLAASPAYLKKYGTPKVPADLSQHQGLIYRGSSGQNRWLFKINSSWQQQSVIPTLVSNNAETLFIGALNDMGIVLFPDWLIGESLKTGTLVSLLSEFAPTIKTGPQNITAIYPNTRQPPLNVRVCIDYFSEVYGNPPYWKYQN